MAVTQLLSAGYPEIHIRHKAEQTCFTLGSLQTHCLPNKEPNKKDSIHHLPSVLDNFFFGRLLGNPFDNDQIQ